MAKLVYSALCSLDGYVADESGDFSWAAPDEEVHGFVNDLEREAGTYLLGRRMYEVLSFWEAPADEEIAGSPAMRDFADVWRTMDKVVYSRSLEEATTARTRIEREFDPAAVAAMKETAERDLAVGGPTLAAQALRAGLVDELQLFLTPIVVGAGKPALPDGLRLPLKLLEEHRFDNGVLFARYST